MTQGNLTTFTADRFGNPNAALDLNGGWTQVPADSYFDTPEITVSVWVYPKTVKPYANIFDFGNGKNSDNIVFSLSTAITNRPFFEIYNSSSRIERVTSSIGLSMNQWQHLAFTFDGLNMIIYLNGIKVSNSSVSYALPSLIRNQCYIGGSNWVSDGYSWSYLDDLRFYNISLTESQIYDLMKLNSTSNICPSTTTTTTTTSSVTSLSESSTLSPTAWPETTWSEAISLSETLFQASTSSDTTSLSDTSTQTTSTYSSDGNNSGY